ncbi:MFS transporter [Streptantibioticus silvisoli]|uniref:MFS transporter n=1 Tax=Streptantibioticus silvisoli TaxID=2705255 RepID=A0ABT6VWI0_9ACTN|nr:MFS transporter [Streptantibioticus silvisoli]MDI5962389.1 MFS transporter [Streptantibioticus silvisoli]
MSGSAPQTLPPQAAVTGSHTRRWWTLGALALSLLIISLDLTILNVALPTMATDLHASTSDLQWFANAYNLVLSIVLLPAGLLGDRFGRKKLLIGALALFGLASAACAWSTTSGQLIASRAVLALGAGFVMILAIAMVPVLFSDEERPKAIGMVSTANFIGIPLGPIVGGWLLDHFWWGSVFLINVPLIAIAVVVVSLGVPETRSVERPRIDLGGILTSSVGLCALSYSAIKAGESGWGNSVTLSCLAAGVVLLVGFVLLQTKASRPLVDLSLFRSPSFTWGTILATLLSFAMFGLLFVLPQYLQAVLGASALRTGLFILPTVFGMIIGVQVSEKTGPRTGAKANVALGYFLVATGMIIGTFTTTSSGYGMLITWSAIVGLGMGFALPAAMDAALGALSRDRAGVGSAVVMSSRQVGGTLGVAILGTVLNSGYRSHLPLAGLPAVAVNAARRSVPAGIAVAQKMNSTSFLHSVRHAFTEAMGSTLWVCGSVALASVLLALFFLPRGLATAAEEAPEKPREHAVRRAG